MKSAMKKSIVHAPTTQSRNHINTVILLMGGLLIVSIVIRFAYGQEIGFEGITILVFGVLLMIIAKVNTIADVSFEFDLKDKKFKLLLNRAIQILLVVGITAALSLYAPIPADIGTSNPFQARTQYAFSPEISCTWIAAGQNNLALVDVVQSETVESIEIPGEPVQSYAVAFDQDRLLTLQNNQNIKMWNIEDYNNVLKVGLANDTVENHHERTPPLIGEIPFLDEPSEEIRMVRISSDGEKFLTVNSDNQIEIFYLLDEGHLNRRQESVERNTRNNKDIPMIKAYAIASVTSNAATIRDAALSPKGDRILTLDNSNHIKTWNIPIVNMREPGSKFLQTDTKQIMLNSENVYKQFDLGQEFIQKILFTKSRNEFITIDAQNQIKLWDIDTGQVLRSENLLMYNR